MTVPQFVGLISLMLAKQLKLPSVIRRCTSVTSLCGKRKTSIDLISVAMGVVCVQ
jgi:hypothetical protein